MSTLKVNAIESAAGGGVAAKIASVNSSHFSHRNLIINGALNHWQRGSSTTTTGLYLADRFWNAFSSAYARSTDAPDGFTYSAKLTYNGSQDHAFGQPIELVAQGNPSPLVQGDKVTFSFYAKTDSGSEDFRLIVFWREAKFSATNQQEFTPVTGSSQFFTANTSWQRFTTTYTVPAIHSGSNILAFEIAQMSRTMYLTGFQLELGDVMTAFEHKNLAIELAQCQRYYQVVRACMRNDHRTDNTSRFGTAVNFFTQMRASPSASTASSVYSQNVSNVGYDRISERGMIMEGNASSSVGGVQGVQVGRDIALDAEL